jgi:uncharacterized alkaline shock family protein YloU
MTNVGDHRPGARDPDERNAVMSTTETRAPEDVRSHARRDEGRPGSGEQRSSDLGGLTLETERGITTLSDDVVAKIAGHACRAVEDVDSLGTQFRRLMGRVRPGKENLNQGVNVEVGRKEAAIDVVIVVRYGYPIPDLSQQVRDRVIGEVEDTTGLDVVEVNIEIDDIEFEEREERRVS